MTNQIADGLNRFGLTSEKYSKLSQDRFSFFVLIFCALSILVQILLIALSWTKLPPQIPIFYSKPWGEAMLSAKVAIWILPALTFVFVVVNYILANFWIRESFLERVLFIFGATFAFAALYDTTKIISLLV